MGVFPITTQRNKHDLDMNVDKNTFAGKKQAMEGCTNYNV